MKAVVQRVKNASVFAEEKTTGSLNSGLLVYLGVARGDSETDVEWMAEKIPNLRIFNDAEGKMNLSLEDLRSSRAGEHEDEPGILAVSQFTLLGDARKGRRPSWGNAAPPEEAKPLYESFIKKIRFAGFICETGVFQTHMEVSYTNDGPVTILLDSRSL